MLTTEQQALLDAEKQKLIEIIEPAINHFRDATGFYPEINIVTEERQTGCGMHVKHVKSDIRVSVIM